MAGDFGQRLVRPLSSAALPFRRDTSAAGYSFVISGPTSKGKTFVTRFVKSLIGHPNRLLPFRASEPGLEEVTQAHRHVPLVLDEPKSTRGNNRGAVQQIAYLSENGEMAIIHSSRQGSPTRIETIVVTGAEDGSLGDRSGGEQVRFIEIPCDPMGPYGIIDQYEKAGVTDHASAQQWIKKRLAGLVANHGHALARFVAKLIELGPEEVTALLDRHMAEFNRLADAQLGPTNSAGLRAREAFAFAYASGLIAEAADIVLWPPEHIQACVLRCLAWHESRLRGTAAPSLGVTAAGEKLLTNLCDRATSSASPSAAALREFGVVLDPSAKQIRATYAFLREVMPHKATYDAVLQSLATQGLVRPGDRPGTWLKQVRYPDGCPRVVCFDLRILAQPMAGDSAEDAAE
jgi:hypothetical protein